jgi:hypothetical protein
MSQKRYRPEEIIAKLRQTPIHRPTFYLSP